MNYSIKFTDRAITEAKNKLINRNTPNSAIRLAVRGSGCNGFKYVIDFEDNKSSEKDIVFDFDVLKIFVDKKSIIYLNGSMIVWEEKLMSQGFKFKNPQETSACSCGKSFSIDGSNK